MMDNCKQNLILDQEFTTYFIFMIQLEGKLKKGEYVYNSSYNKIKQKLKELQIYRYYLYESNCIVFVKYTSKNYDIILNEIKKFNPKYGYTQFVINGKFELVNFIDDVCSICLESFNIKSLSECKDAVYPRKIELECNHLFHENCLKQIKVDECSGDYEDTKSYEDNEFELGYSGNQIGYCYSIISCPLCRKENCSILIPLEFIMKYIDVKNEILYINESNVFKGSSYIDNQVNDYPNWFAWLSIH